MFAAENRQWNMENTETGSSVDFPGIIFSCPARSRVKSPQNSVSGVRFRRKSTQKEKLNGLTEKAD